MKASRDNLFTDGASGTAKNMTFSKSDSGELLIKARRGPSSKPMTAGQLAVKERFTEAIIYGRSVVKNPEKRAVYHAFKRPNFNAYTLAVQDFLRAPKVNKITTLEYTGLAGEPLVVRATDDFKVAQVKVWIRSADGAIIESGDAVMQENELDWLYTTTVANGELAGSKITAVAFDLPNNQHSLEITV